MNLPRLVVLLLPLAAFLIALVDSAQFRVGHPRWWALVVIARHLRRFARPRSAVSTAPPPASSSLPTCPGSQSPDIHFHRRHGRHQPLAGHALDLPDAASACCSPGTPSRTAPRSSTPSCCCWSSAWSASFCAQDLFLFYVFWEICLVPMYFLIGIWGHERRIYAAVKFFLYTMAGSVLMLAAIIYLYNRRRTFSYPGDPRHARQRPPDLQPSEADCCCSWRSSSPSPSRCRSSRCTPGCRTRTWKRPPPVRSCWPRVMLKMGTYGILHFCLPLFPAPRASAPRGSSCWPSSASSTARWWRWCSPT